MERGFDLVTDDVAVVDKFEAEWSGHPYYKVKLGGLGWGFDVSCIKDVFDFIDVGKSYSFEAHYDLYNGNPKLRFVGVVSGK